VKNQIEKYVMKKGDSEISKPKKRHLKAVLTMGSPTLLGCKAGV
jgi:hypothetical protein